MGKFKNIVFNHEVWKKCSNCGNHFDLRTFGYQCPDCKTEN